MAKHVLLKNARLINGLADQPVEKAAILITGERIAAVERGEMTPPEGTTVIDLGGQTILPGLIDTHVHTTLMGDEGLALFIAAGVTSVRDTGGKLEAVRQLKEAVSSGEKLGPRLYICGPMFDGATPSFDYPLFLSLLESVPSPDVVSQKVKPILDAGVDCVKLYFTLTLDTAEAIIRYVEGRVPITGHLGYLRASEAVRAGISGLEHVWISPYNDVCAAHMRFGQGASMMAPNFWVQTLKGWEEADLSGPGARALLDEMAKREVAMGTTLDLLWLARVGFEGARQDSDRRYIPPEVLSRQKAMSQRLGELPDWDINLGFFDPTIGKRALEKHQEFTRLLHEAGGVIVGGTDGGAIPFPPPGFALLRELELLSEPLGCMNAIRAVTSQAARHLRKQDDIGAVAPGRFADLLVVNGDPLNDIRDLRKLTTVYKGGVAHDPKAILAGLPMHEHP